MVTMSINIMKNAYYVKMLIVMAIISHSCLLEPILSFLLHHLLIFLITGHLAHTSIHHPQNFRNKVVQALKA